jgi:hypothetical protein
VNNKGIALIITLLVLTLLLTMILEFSMDMRVEARAAANFRDDVQAYYLARSGVTFAIAVLEEDLNEDSKKSAKTDALNELWAQKIPPVPVGSGTVTVAITDEDSKININKLDKGNPPATGANMRALMTNFLKQFELIEGLKILLGQETHDLFTIVRLQNQYEPWAMLMQAIANPDSVMEDPQLRDFLKGVKLRFKVGDFPYLPQEQMILKDILLSE